MSKKKNKSSDGIFKSILFAHIILLLHILLFAALGVIVVFIDGVMQNLFWILFGGLAIVGLALYWFYRRLRKQGKSLWETLRSPVFQGRKVEVSFLGGMATLKLDQYPTAGEAKVIEGNQVKPSMQLEDPETVRLKQINNLAELLEKDLITQEEFNKVKQRLLK